MTGVQLQLLTQFWKLHLKNIQQIDKLHLGNLWLLSKPCPGSVTLGQSFTSPGILFLSYFVSLVCWISREESGFFFHFILLPDASHNTKKNIPTHSGSVSALILHLHMKAELFSSCPECCHKQMHIWECVTQVEAGQRSKVTGSFTSPNWNFIWTKPQQTFHSLKDCALRYSTHFCQHPAREFTAE